MSEVHDNLIKNYYVDFENQKIILNTIYFDKEITSIEFNNVMAYYFEDIEMHFCFGNKGISGNIIFDIENKTLESFIEDYGNGLKNGKKMWYFQYNEDELLTLLRNNNQKYYCINATYGLNGWILAENMITLVNEIK